MTKRRIVVDADVVAFKAASALERAVEWEPGFWTLSVNFHDVCSRTLDLLEDLKERLDADEATLCLTDPDHNFRLDVLPSYKTHRKADRKPLVLYHLKEYLVDEHDALMVPGLEGDDLMGIIATKPSREERIIVSIDKDMKTIPCNYVRTEPRFNEDGVEIESAWDIQKITPEEADKNWLKQTLSGDVTDGYSGCPGIGATIADKIIEEGLIATPYEHTLASGKRKGQTETRFKYEPHDNLWEVVVSRFRAAGLGEEEALRQARVARILRYSDYDFDKKEPILWTP